MNPSKHKMSVLKQIFKLISKLARKHGVDKQARSFSLALVFGQLSHALGLNDICDSLRNHKGMLTAIREATPPSRNGFSHANRFVQNFEYIGGTNISNWQIRFEVWDKVQFLVNKKAS